MKLPLHGVYIIFSEMSISTNIFFEIVNLFRCFKEKLTSTVFEPSPSFTIQNQDKEVRIGNIQEYHYFKAYNFLNPHWAPFEITLSNQ